MSNQVKKSKYLYWTSSLRGLKMLVLTEYLVQENQGAETPGGWTAPYCADSTNKGSARGRINESKTSLLNRFKLLMVNAFGFQNIKEIFCYCIVIAVSPSWYGKNNTVFFSQIKVCLGSILKPLVAVEVQLPNDFFFVHGKANGIQHQLHCLLGRSFVAHNTIVV